MLLMCGSGNECVCLCQRDQVDGKLCSVQARFRNTFTSLGMTCGVIPSPDPANAVGMYPPQWLANALSQSRVPNHSASPHTLAFALSEGMTLAYTSSENVCRLRIRVCNKAVAKSEI